MSEQERANLYQRQRRNRFAFWGKLRSRLTPNPVHAQRVNRAWQPISDLRLDRTYTEELEEDSERANYGLKQEDERLYPSPIIRE